MKYHYIVSIDEVHNRFESIPMNGEYEHHTKTGMLNDCAILDRYEIDYSVKTVEQPLDKLTDKPTDNQ